MKGQIKKKAATVTGKAQEIKNTFQEKIRRTTE